MHAQLHDDEISLYLLLFILLSSTQELSFSLSVHMHKQSTKHQSLLSQ
jgi:hypothetical protein